MDPNNPVYKKQVGEAIYGFVLGYIGPEHAPKVTGMLIDLPINDIGGFLINYDTFIKRVA